MKITLPQARNPTAKEFHARRCFMLGITEPDKVARLWLEEKKFLEEARAAVEGPRLSRRRRGFE
jgi:hypothetical protein